MGKSTFDCCLTERNLSKNYYVLLVVNNVNVKNNLKDKVR